MRITLIGGKGGVGRLLIGVLKDQHELTVLDRSTTPLPGVREIVGEADDPAALESALDGADAVVHLAAVIPRGSEAEQLPGTAQAIAVNVGSVLLAMRMARILGVRSFVHISSLSVFERYAIDPIAAGTAPDATEIYGLSKRVAELALQVACEGPAPTAQEQDITVTSLRLAFPTTAEAWPHWVGPLHGPEDAPTVHTMADGTVVCGLHPTDLAAAVLAAIDRTKGRTWEAIAVTAAPETIADDAAERLLGWRPRWTLERAAEGKPGRPG